MDDHRNPELYLSTAAMVLRKIEPQNCLPIAVSGVRLVCSAAETAPGLPFLQAEQAFEMAGLFAGAASMVAASVAPAIIAEDVYAGLGMASALLTHAHADFDADRISHARIFAARVELLYERRRLNRRGDNLTRSIQIGRAASVVPVPGHPLH